MKKYHQHQPIVLLDLSHNAELFRGIASQAAEFGWKALDLDITRGSILPGIEPVGLLTQRFLDDPLVQRMREEGRPVVRVGNLPKEGDDSVLPAILPDLTMAGRLAADHFVERRFKYLAYIGNLPWHERPMSYRAFRDRAKELGCTCQLLQVKPKQPPTSRQEYFDFRMAQISDWLLTLPKPVGVFTYNDLQAAVIFTAARLIGLESPEEVALLGIGNDPATCDLLPVPLSSIDKNQEERGHEAVVLLKQLIDGETVPERPMMIPAKGIVERQSTNLLAVPDPVVARALRFIWDHYAEQLAVEDIAAVAGVARSTICRKFQECLGRGVNAELRRKRLERCTVLLRSTEMTVAEIAAVSGFPSLPYLFKAFHDEFGLTPREYRLRHTS